jgi:hypothetical protein
MEKKAKTATAKKETAKKATGTKSAAAKAKAPKKKTVRAAAEGAAPAKRCQIGSCKREYRAKGYCATHYREWRHGKFGRARFKTCKDFGCAKPMARNRHGFCEEHFQNYYVKGMEQTKIPAAAPAAAPAAKAEEKVA